MSKKSDVIIRAMAERHCKAILTLAYEAFPFERERELEMFGSDFDALAKLKEMVGPFSKTGSVHLVAIDEKDKVLGFVVVKGMASVEGRISKSVLAMPRITVAEKSRGKGVGSMLLARARSFAADQGYGELMASIPEHLKDWYERAGWAVSSPGDIYTVLEQPHPGDDKFLSIPVPSGRGGQFAPFQSQEPGPAEHGYTIAASIATKNESKLIKSWTYPAEGDDQFRSLWRILMENPSLISKVPFMNCIILGQFMHQAGVEKKEMELFTNALMQEGELQVRSAQ